MLLACLVGLAPLSIATALAPSMWIFVVVQLPVYALKGVLMTLIPVMVTESLVTERRARGHL